MPRVLTFCCPRVANSEVDSSKTFPQDNFALVPLDFHSKNENSFHVLLQGILSHIPQEISCLLYLSVSVRTDRAVFCGELKGPP